MTNSNMTPYGGFKSPQRMLDEAAAMEKAGPLGSIWTHQKSGEIYEVTGFCFLEKHAEPAVLYCKHGSSIPEPIWARAASEFFDGRFTLKTDA